VRFIDRGGMSEVFEAEDLELRSRVALKTLGGDGLDPLAVERFRREVQLARRITHPNVCRIFDTGVHHTPARDIRFLTMELLDGETLSARLARVGRLALPDALAIVRQIVPALAAAHEQGIIHRDFKSGNVILSPSRQGERAVVTDFGLARVSVEESDATVSGGIVGTPAYMAPEQVEGGAITASVDIYALGVVVFEMVTGGRPFTGDTPLAIAVKRLRQDPTPPRALVPDLDLRWQAVILRCLERRSERRFQTAWEVLAALEGGVVAPPPGRARRRAWLGVTALLALLTLTALMAARARWWATPARSLPSPTESARPSVAVLGFKNLGRSDQAWLSTAITEMLRTELAVGEKIRTISGESVARVKMDLALADTDSLARDSLNRLGSNLGANLVVLGSYLALPSGKIRLDLRLQDTRGGEILASAAEEGTEEGLFGLVSRGGARIRSALRIEGISEGEASAARASFPSNPDAARYFAEGLARLRVFDALAARELLERAVAAQPNHPLSHAALGRAWAALGYDGKAQAESRKALEFARSISREERLGIEAQVQESSGEVDKALEIYRSLFVFFPDSLDHGLRLAEAQTAAGHGQDALATVAVLRKLPAPADADPRLELAEAAAAKVVTDFARQRATATEAARKARQLGARLLLAQARLAEASAAVNLGDLKAAETAAEDAGRMFTEAGDAGGAARAQNVVAVARARQGDLAGARSRFEEALRAFRRIGDQRGIAAQLSNLGNVLSEQGELAQARASNEEALAVSREIADRNGMARDLNNLGAVLWDQGDLPAARRAFEEAVGLFHALGAKQNEAGTLSSLGEVLAKRGESALAEQRFRQSLEISRSLDRELAVETLGHLARVLEKRGDHEGVRRARADAAALERAIGSKQ
jgi:tetratricopeptide (TPR) repeat protein